METPSFVMPATLQVFRDGDNIFHPYDVQEHIKELMRGWICSPMVEMEGFGQSRLNICFTMDRLVDVIQCATSQSDEEVEEAIGEFISFHLNEQEALQNLKSVFLGYCGSVVVEKAGEGEKRGAVVDTYYELVAIFKELFAKK